jgi:Ca-activated chloride channel homolog
MSGFGFANPWALLLLLAIPVYVRFVRRRRDDTLTFSRAGVLAGVAPRITHLIAQAPGWLRGVGFAALVIAIAAPRTGASMVDIDAEGIAIVLVVDVSSSMLAEDMASEDEEGRRTPRNRIVVAKQTVAEFVRGRDYDRIGLVAFAGEALTQVPITVDYPVIYQAIEQLQVASANNMLEDGTAIGTAIATAANRLRRAPGESRVMILMTDGENNRGEIDPLTAARAAAAFDIKIYTVGVGSDGLAPIPVSRNAFGVQYATLQVSIDEDLLRNIADVSGGRYFRATNASALDSIYQNIDQLERSDVQVRRYVSYTPHYLPFIVLAMMSLVGEWALRGSRFGRVP